jgi:hypothetical protein
MGTMFSGRPAVLVPPAAIVGGCLAGCGSSSPSGHGSSSSAGQVSQPGKAGLPPGQGQFTIQSATTAFNSSQQSTTGRIEGEVDGLALTAPSMGNPAAGQGCFFGTLGSSASGTFGGVPFTVQPTSCDVSSDNSHVYGTYTGNWGGRPVNITVTEDLASDEARNGSSDLGTDLPTFSGTIWVTESYRRCHDAADHGHRGHEPAHRLHHYLLTGRGSGSP